MGWWGGRPQTGSSCRQHPPPNKNRHLLSHSAGCPLNPFIMSPTDLHSCVQTATIELFEAISRSTRPRSATLGSFSFMFQVTTPTWIESGSSSPFSIGESPKREGRHTAASSSSSTVAAVPRPDSADPPPRCGMPAAAMVLAREFLIWVLASR